MVGKALVFSSFVTVKENRTSGTTLICYQDFQYGPDLIKPHHNIHQVRPVKMNSEDPEFLIHIFPDRSFDFC